MATQAQNPPREQFFMVSPMSSAKPSPWCSKRNRSSISTATAVPLCAASVHVPALPAPYHVSSPTTVVPSMATVLQTLTVGSTPKPRRPLLSAWMASGTRTALLPGSSISSAEAGGARKSVSAALAARVVSLFQGLLLLFESMFHLSCCIMIHDSAHPQSA